MRKTYSESFRNRVVKQLLSPNGKSASEVAGELGLAQSTISRWRKQAITRSLPRTMSNGAARAKRESEWNAQEKFDFLLEAATCSDEELGALLRGRGVFEATYRQWRQAALTGLTGPQKQTQAEAKERREDKKRVRRLERELRRKDKALAETAALLVLKKKLPYLLGVEDDSTTESND
jgi:transposase-like protein